MRVLRHEHRRLQHVGLPHLHRQGLHQPGEALPPAAHVRDQGLGARHDQLLGPVREHSAVAQDQEAQGGRAEGVLADPSGPQEARRDVRVHPVRVLLHELPFVLVERRLVPRPCRAHAGENDVPLYAIFFPFVDGFRTF